MSKRAVVTTAISKFRNGPWLEMAELTRALITAGVKAEDEDRYTLLDLALISNQQLIDAMNEYEEGD